MGVKLATVIDIVWPVIDINIVITYKNLSNLSLKTELHHFSLCLSLSKLLNYTCWFLWAVKFVSFTVRENNVWIFLRTNNKENVWTERRGVTEAYGKMYYVFQSSLNSIELSKWRRMIWSALVRLMRDIWTRNRFLGRETKGKQPLEILRGKQDNIKVETIKMLCWGVDWIRLWLSGGLFWERLCNVSFCKG
jgi:hypothetical protein